MRLAPTSRSDLVRRLRAFGWSGPYPGGRHQFMLKGHAQLTIPNPHGGREIGTNLLKIVLTEAGISREDWLSQR
jgi:predicted RNA binding protein YcfA (HicA-like mRNA interferase family)